MTSMGMTAPTARAATRALAVLAVLLGLLAMHGLSSTHHAAASPPPHAAPPATAAHAAVEAAPEAEAGAHHHAVALPAAALPAAALPAALHSTVALVGGPGASCDDGCPDLAMLCLYVLTGAALALLLARRRSSWLLVAPARPRAPGPAPPVRHARGPDPVRELCVSRT